MKIAVVGTGYVGLVTGTCFAETGNVVNCVDVNKAKIDQLKKGKCPIYEPGLDVLLQRNIKEKRILFTTDLKAAIDKSDIIFLALPTPPGEDGSADLKYILNVAEDLSEIIKEYKVIVNKSTVPVGTAEKVAEVLGRKLAPELFDVVSNPEFLREGIAVDDFLKPDRVVIGTSSDRARDVMNELYQPFVRQGNPIYFMDERSSEMTKYVANSYLAMRISYMNEVANLCELTGANVDLVRIGIGSDSRIGKRFLFPGIGYGGSCFPKDVLALHHTSKQNKYDFKLLDTVMKVNKNQKKVLFGKIKRFYKNSLKGKKFAMWGLAFKPETDDIRDAPALELINEILNAGAEVTVFDPEAMANVKAIFGNKIKYARDQYTGLKEADALLIVTEWSEFRNPDFERMVKNLKSKVVFDGRNVYSLEKMEELGFYYNSIGRKIVNGKN
ncbi:UDP-glucose/GDP-mannose dehydrogenase family protein [Niabella yanshanensis]|uniref:UDP-glucose 6-dehydrogenase n=1 Tax=Niabella yanshanensis TaxID=577386 RepID=A0ABZ0W3B0_9BACT|nr:UDP-glucose/GDP-mannose dehydrogenase family protein [Niabella yanshanensis]WQD37108.1 UDP-glucose/GDP-mannose dehydrogenase family protein [Niabella yanshanensis]